MSYQVIPRKWRPQSFAQLVGQDHISTTLTNALKNGRLPHALLFTGPRGTGKTSSARILAKALRCPNAVDFIACNKCSECDEISLSRSPNVVEIDGASNNGVDAIRELRDTVMYSPSSGKYKVYIIDEVHMLSTSAFNALLKTLEEPPDHVVFIMATTEVHKIPLTILSRCQRFDFRRIGTRQISEKLKEICQSEGLQAEDDALWIIARQGDGSMRDSQSLLDQVITFANGPLTHDSVVQILGLTDRSVLLGTLRCLIERDAAGLLPNLEKISLAGYEAHLFLNDLLENIRHLLLLKVSGNNTQVLVELPDSEIRFLQELGHASTEEDVHLLFDMTLKAASDVPRTTEPEILLEMALLRMVNAPRVQSLQAFLSGAPRPQENTARASSVAAKTTPAQKAPAPSLRSNLPANERWYEFVQLLKSKDSLLAAKIEPLVFVAAKDKVLELSVLPTETFIKTQMEDKATRDKLQSLVDQYWGPGYALKVAVAQSAPTGLSVKAQEQALAKSRQTALEEQMAAHPKVRAASLIFKGQIKSIKEST